MDERIQQRIETLRKELEVGQQRMRELEQQLAQLRDTMLRISGAIQVLEELQTQAATPTAGAPDSGNSSE
jgi:prefoldin subunit 5